MAATAYHYELPEGTDDRPKVIVDIAETDLMKASVHVVRNGGETNLHAHNGEDSLWFVVGGRVAFYDENGARCELGAHEGIVFPSGTKYWFESVGSEPLEILRVGARDPRVMRSRSDATQRTRRPGSTLHFEAERVDAVSA